MKNLHKILAGLLLALAACQPAFAANQDKTIRDYDQVMSCNTGDSFLIQRNSTGPYFYINCSDLKASVLTGVSTAGISGSYLDLTNKPTLLSQFTNDVPFVTATTAPVTSVNTLTGSVVLTTSNINDSTDKRYITDAQRTVLAATSGSNTGDQTISDATISLTDILTGNASTSKHGFLPKLNGNVNTFLDGTGGFSSPAGAGTVTTVSVVTASGVSGTVANPTTTPALTISLGAITPTSVNASGNVAGANLSGSNSGDVTLSGEGYLSATGQAITVNAVNLSGSNATGTLAAARFPSLTGDISNSAGSLTTSLASIISPGSAGSATAVPVISWDAKGRVVAGSATNISIPASAINNATISSGASVSGSNTGDQVDSTLPFTDITTGNSSTSKHGFLPKLNGSATSYLDGTGAFSTPPSASGTVTSVSVVTANGVSATVANASTTPALTFSLGNITPGSINSPGTIAGSNLSGTNTGDQTITLTSDVTGSGTGSFATTIANSAVTNAKMANMADQRFKGNVSGSSAAPADLTPSQVKTALAIASTDVSGLGTLATASSVSLSTQATGTLQAAQFPALSGDVTTTSGSLGTTISAGAVTNADLATMTNGTFKGNTSGITASPSDLTASQMRTGLSLVPGTDVQAHSALLDSAAGLTISQGDLLFGSGSQALSNLPKNTSATRYVSNTGSSNSPAWAQVDLTSGVTGVLPVANGGSQNVFIPADNTCATDVTTALEIFMNAHGGHAVLRPGDCLQVSNLGAGVVGSNSFDLTCPTKWGCQLKSLGTNIAVKYYVPDTVAFDSRNLVTAIGTSTINNDDANQTYIQVADASGYSRGDYGFVVDSIQNPDDPPSSKATISNVVWDSGNSVCTVTVNSTSSLSSTNKVFISGVTGTSTFGTALMGTDGWGRMYNITLGDGNGANTTTKFTLQTINNMTDTTNGTNVNCATGAYSAGGKVFTQNTYAGESFRVGSVDLVNNRIYTEAPLETAPLLVIDTSTGNVPIVLRWTKARTFNLKNIYFGTLGNPDDVTASNSQQLVDVAEVPEANFESLYFDHPVDAAIFRRSDPGSTARDLYGSKLVNRATIVTGSNPITITGVTSANPAVFTTSGTAPATNHELGLVGLPTGWTGLASQLYRAVNLSTTTFELVDTWGNPINATGFPTWTGTATTADDDNVTGLGYLETDQSACYNCGTDGMVADEGRHAHTTGTSQLSWNALPTSGTSIGLFGSPTYGYVWNVKASATNGRTLDSHEATYKYNYRNWTISYPERGPTFGSYEGAWGQDRGGDTTYSNIDVEGGKKGLRIVANTRFKPDFFDISNIKCRGFNAADGSDNCLEITDWNAFTNPATVYLSGYFDTTSVSLPILLGKEVNLRSTANIRAIDFDDVIDCHGGGTIEQYGDTTTDFRDPLTGPGLTGVWTHKTDAGGNGFNVVLERSDATFGNCSASFYGNATNIEGVGSNKLASFFRRQDTTGTKTYYRKQFTEVDPNAVGPSPEINTGTGMAKRTDVTNRSQNISFQGGTGIQSGKTVADTLLAQVYDTGLSSFTTFITGTAGSPAAMDISNSATWGTKSLVLAGNFATSGTSALTLTTTGATNVTLPTTGTLVASPVANASLGTMVNNTIKGNVSGITAAPSDLTLTNLLDIAGNTRGSVLERGASGWTIVTPGTSGNVLTSNGSGADPTYQAVTGSGTVNSGTSGQIPYYASSTNAVSGNANLTISSAALTLGVTGTATGSEIFSGATTGAVTIKPQAAAGTWEFDLPITAGGAGQVLTSQGGLGTPMTWTTAGTGTVTGPGSSTSTAIALYNGTGGTAIQNSVVTVDGSGNTAGMGTLASAAHTITSASSSCFSLGANGASNPAFSVDCSASSVANGLKLTPTAAGSGVTLAIQSSGTNDALTLKAKGNGNATLTTDTTSGSAKMQVSGSDRISAAQAHNDITVGTSSTAATPRFTITGAADTNLTAATEGEEIQFNLGQTRTWASNTTVALNRSMVILPPTYAFTTSGGTMTEVGTLAVSPPNGGTNATLTQSEGYLASTTALTNVTNGYGGFFNAPSGATSNWAAAFVGNVALRGTVPTISSCGSGSIVTGSSNHKGQITGVTAATACTITFSAPLDTAPACTFSDSAGTAVGISSISTSAVTTSMTALTGTLYYICF